MKEVFNSFREVYMRYLVFLICIFSINLKSEVYEIRDYTIEEEWFEAYVTGQKITSCLMEMQE